MCGRSLMAPKKKAAASSSAAAAETPAAAATPAKLVSLDAVDQDDDVEFIEEIMPVEDVPQRTVTFVLDGTEANDQVEEEDEDEYDDDEGLETDDDELHDDITTAVGQLTQLMMTEDGEAITDVLQGVRESLEKQNKILYRGLQLLEQRFPVTRR